MGEVLLPGLHANGGTIAGRYRVERVLGTGPSAYVVLARHAILRERVTLKIFARRSDLRAAHAAARVESPHVARVVDTGFTEDGMPFVAYAHVAGEVLSALVEPMRFDDAAHVAALVTAGLADAHAAGVVHGNVKPSNVLRAEDGTVRVLDFGARPVEETTWRSSPAYTAPEQIADPTAVSPAADVWAAAVLFHWLVTGRVPFHADTVAGMLVAVTFDAPTIALRGPMAALVERSLAKDPAARPSMSALREAFAPYVRAPRATLAGMGPAPAPPAPPDVPLRAPRATPASTPWSAKLADWRSALVHDRRLLVAGATSMVVAATLLLPVDEAPRSTRARFEPPPWEPPNREPLAIRPLVPPSFVEPAETPSAQPAALPRETAYPAGFTHPTMLHERRTARRP